MNRRDFIKGTLAVSASLALPLTLTGRADAQLVQIDDGIYYEDVTREIHLTKGMTLQELYSTLKERWKEDDELIKLPFPMLAMTDAWFEMQNDWNIHENSIPMLGRGTLNQNGEYYTSIIVLGEFEGGIEADSYYLEECHFPSNEYAVGGKSYMVKDCNRVRVIQDGYYQEIKEPKDFRGTRLIPLPQKVRGWT